MIIKIKMSLGVGYAGCDREDEHEFQIDDNATDEQIEKEAEEIANEWAHQFLDIGFSTEKVKQDGQQ